MKKNGENTDTLVKNIENLVPNGSTNIYDTAIQGLNILAQEDFGIYNVSIIIMTDGQSNVGTFESFAQRYDNIGLDIPVYSILFGEAYERELRDIASKTNGKAGRVLAISVLSILAKEMAVFCARIPKKAPKTVF